MNRSLRRIRRRMATMPEPEREVFRRARFRDLDYNEIGAELDVTVAEVERLMASAIRHLVGWQ